MTAKPTLRTFVRAPVARQASVPTFKSTWTDRTSAWRSGKPRPMPGLALLAGLLVLSGCATYGGATLLHVPIDVTPPLGFALPKPDAIRTPTGTRFHGSICRRSTAMSPTRVRLELIGARGEVIASASTPLWGLRGRARHCAFYDVPTNWTVSAAERVRVCALRSDTSCGGVSEETKSRTRKSRPVNETSPPPEG